MKRSKLKAKWKRQAAERHQNEQAVAHPKYYDRKSLKGKKEKEPCRRPNSAKDASTGSTDLEIPGFYYDQEKKKYFKIQPNHSSISSTVTREIIQRKEKEEQRLKEIAKSEKRTKKVKSVSKTVLGNSKTLCAFPHLLNNLHLGSITNHAFEDLFMFKRIPNIALSPTQSCTVSNVHIELEHMNSMEISENQDYMLGLWSLRESVVNKIKLLHIKKSKRINATSRLCVEFDSQDNWVMNIWNKVTHLCWANCDNDFHSVLFTTTSFTNAGDDCSKAALRKFSTASEPAHTEFSIGNKYTWTCAWNTHGQNFSIGSEKCGLLIDAESRKLWELHTNNSDPLTQIFATKTRHCLFSGTRKNQILGHDLRSISTRPTVTMGQSCSICSLRLLQEESKLLASDVKGRVCLWDLRMRRVVRDYRGLENKYCRIPIHVDEKERLVYGADADGYVRFWNLCTGELLRTLPPPSSLPRDFIPSVAYSERWAGEEGNAGLLMGLRDKIYFYSSFVGTEELPKC